MVHKRSQISIVRRHAIANARRDRELAETISMSTKAELSDEVQKEFGYVDQHVIYLAPGDILTDSRRRGVLQKKNPAKTEFLCRIVCTRKGRTLAIPLIGR